MLETQRIASIEMIGNQITRIEVLDDGAWRQPTEQEQITILGEPETPGPSPTATVGD